LRQVRLDIIAMFYYIGDLDSERTNFTLRYPALWTLKLYMGYKSITLKVTTLYDEEILRKQIAGSLRIRKFTYQIESKSLDARNKGNIHWLMKIGVNSEEIKDGLKPVRDTLVIPGFRGKQEVVVTGSGPAGFFCALVLQKAGFSTTLIDRGSDVHKRNNAILNFERDGIFDPQNNYAFGEGGAGTFSDGKLTSRSKHISKERDFILSSYIDAGAPAEIAWMAHPHLGTDNLKKIVKNLRQNFLDIGGRVLFETMLEDISAKDGVITEAITSAGPVRADALFIAPGHSAFETYRMLIRRGVGFRTKNFAIGSRMEHRQEVINQIQWGKPRLPGVKAAEYRISSQADGKHQVYSFCMCPGGIVVPATAYANTNIVNGMSYYKRNGYYANAACVAGIHPDELAGKVVSPSEALDYLENLENQFYQYARGYEAPSCSIKDFISSKIRDTNFKSSYPLGLQSAQLWKMLPSSVAGSIRSALIEFTGKMRGFDTGNLIGLESKTSSPIQVIREEGGLCAGFANLFVIGEGSGYAGGIISSAADGVKSAMHYSTKHSDNRNL
jgi:uncharacterized protein